MNFPSKSLNFSFYENKESSEMDSNRTGGLFSSENSMNSSRFEEVKHLRKQRDNQVLQKIMNTQKRFDDNCKKVVDCFQKFRPVKKNSKEN